LCRGWGATETYLKQGFEPKGFSATIIECNHDHLNLFLGHRGEGMVLWSILANQVNGVFTEPVLFSLGLFRTIAC